MINYKNIVLVTLIGVWSTLIFEIGLSFFIEKLGYSLFNIFVSLLILLFIWGVLTYKITIEVKYNQYIKILFILYALYWGFSLIGVIYSSEISVGFMDVLQYIYYSFILFVTIVFFNNLDFKYFKKMLQIVGIISLLVLCFFTYYSLSSGVAINSLNERNRFSISPFDDYNVFVYSMLLALGLIFINKKLSTKTLMLYLILCIIIIIIGVISGSRRALILYGPITLIVPCILILLKNNIRMYLKAIFPILFIVTIIYVVITNLNIYKIGEYFQLNQQAMYDLQQKFERGIGFYTGYYSDTSSRTDRWDKAVEIIENSNMVELVIGKGTRSFFSESVFIRQNGGKDSPHNFILSSFIEGGIIKVSLIFLFIISFFYLIIKQVKRGEFWTMVFILGSFFAWLITTLISGLEFFYSKQFILILLVVYYLQLEIKHKERIINND